MNLLSLSRRISRVSTTLAKAEPDPKTYNGARRRSPLPHTAAHVQVGPIGGGTGGYTWGEDQSEEEQENICERVKNEAA
eukprot:8396381-Pyramimonas_sp.AAC.1